MNHPDRILSDLMGVIEDRKANPRTRSYTNSLLAGGVEKIGAKIMEEAGEVVEAARQAETEAGRPPLVHEAADLLYHLLVLLCQRDVELGDVAAELARRFGTSGLDEKAARSASKNPS